MIRTAILFTIVTTAILACSSEQEVVVPQTETIELVSFEQVGKGALFGDGQEGIVETQAVLRSEEDWTHLKQQMDSVNEVTREFRDQDLDFSKEMIIVCVDKLRGSGGYEIEIIDILEYPKKIVVIVEQVNPSEMATSVMTQPFHVVKIPISEKQIVFKEKE